MKQPITNYIRLVREKEGEGEKTIEFIDKQIREIKKVINSLKRKKEKLKISDNN